MNEWLTVKEISEQTGTKVHAVLKRLKRNAKEGEMYQPSGKGGVWLVKREAYLRIFSVKRNKIEK